jgi:hypothetical protein
MPENESQNPADVPNGSAPFGTVPHRAESFGKLPNGSEGFRNIPHASERKENHTLTVRDVARMFEAAGVARTERSVTNWCQPNRSGIARLDAFFDPNERRYFITPQSAEVAIQEERARMAKTSDSSELGGSVPNASERQGTPPTPVSEASAGQVKALEQEILDLKITNKGKDYFIEQLQKERVGFAQERQDYVEKLVSANRKVGELEAKLLALEAPSEANGRPVT